MTDDLIKRLRRLRVVLKCGEYDGSDIMEAWIVAELSADALEALQSRLEAAERNAERWRTFKSRAASRWNGSYLINLHPTQWDISMDAAIAQEQKRD